MIWTLDEILLSMRKLTNELICLFMMADDGDSLVNLVIFVINPTFLQIPTQSTYHQSDGNVYVFIGTSHNKDQCS